MITKISFQISKKIATAGKLSIVGDFITNWWLISESGLYPEKRENIPECQSLVHDNTKKSE